MLRREHSLTYFIYLIPLLTSIVLYYISYLCSIHLFICHLFTLFNFTWRGHMCLTLGHEQCLKPLTAYGCHQVRSLLPLILIISIKTTQC